MAIDIRKLAKTHNLRQRELAEILQTDQSVVSLIVNGHRRLNEEHIEMLRAHFGAEELAKFEYKPLAPMQTQATILPADVVEEIQEEARNDLRQAIEEMAKRVDVLEEMIRQQNRMLDIMEKMVATLERR